METLAQQYGRALYHVRVDHGISRAQVVADNHISLNALSDMENGKSLVKLDNLQMLLNYYGLDMTTFARDYLNSPVVAEDVQTLVNATPDTRFFVLDTKGAVAANKYADADFVQYSWNARRFNKVREGDWFIYRRPKSVSETKQWYLFGAGQIERITASPDGARHATIGQAFPFSRYLLAEPDLAQFDWQFKPRTQPNWNNFFNMYGMTQITQADFERLLTLANASLQPAELREEGLVYRQIATGDYAVTETSSLSKKRMGQNVLAELVKSDYAYQCAVTGIHTREFLVASHIIPWRVDVKRRLDPGNVICLSSLWDRAFDQGFVTFDAKDRRIRVSAQVGADPALAKALVGYDGRVLRAPARYLPEREALEYHNDEVFRG